MTRRATAGPGHAVLGDYLVEEQVGFLLRRAQQRHAAIFQDGMHAAGGLTATQFTALVKIVELGQVTQNLLGRLTAMDPATIQGVVRRLAARGLVRRQPDPMDRRAAVLVATPAGLDAVRPAVACARAITTATLQPLDAGERRALLALLRKLGNP
ncbi:MAG: winged helix-turn-helix transcriptional regulator [Rhodospirillales bacterium]|nr:MarR family winged helix-turn-helix transcriptional regulator [Rhodospirillales bacterium]MDE2199277.1 winged helix-turn-helix transcriptional regulator [Rhodospirillales bacterium]MDE2576368.1 winged helix-turn-helix transcriptional regulator [Rhodospirillales bacterium]